MKYYIIAGLNLSGFAFASAIALLKFKTLDKGMRFFAASCVLGLLTEAIALYSAIRYKNNMPVYAIYNIVEVFLICMFLNYTMPVLEKRKIGPWLGIVSILLGIANLVFFQSLYDLNNNFIYYQGIVVIGLCMFSIIDEIRSSEESNTRFSARFYISVLLIIYWVVSFLYWGIYEYLISIFGKDNIMVNYMMVCVCFLLNIAFSILLLRFPKTKSDV